MVSRNLDAKLESWGTVKRSDFRLICESEQLLLTVGETGELFPSFECEEVVVLGVNGTSNGVGLGDNLERFICHLPVFPDDDSQIKRKSGRFTVPQDSNLVSRSPVITNMRWNWIERTVTTTGLKLLEER